MVFWLVIGEIIHWPVYPIIYWNCVHIDQCLTV